MSLIVATSRLPENSVATDAEKPAHFINYFRSPIEIEPDSEIAVESIKLKRTGNVTISSANYFTDMWGEDPLVRAEDEANLPAGVDNRSGANYQLNIPRRIQLPAKTYEVGEYVSRLADIMNAQYADPRIFNNHSATLNTDSAGVEKGLNIKYTSRTTASNQVPNTIATTYFNLKAPGITAPSNAFSYNPVNGDFQRTGTTATSSKNCSCVAVIKNRPFALNGGKFTYTFVNASANYVIVGLNRPMVQYKRRIGGNKVKSSDLLPFGYSNNFILEDGTELPPANRPRHHLDYGLIVNDSGVYIFNSMANDERDKLRHYEIKYWESGGSHSGARMTKSQFYASYDRVRFTGEYDAISVSFGQKGKAVYDPMCGPALSTDPQNCLKPISDNTYALYPVINIGQAGVSTEINELDSYDSPYAYPEFIEGVGRDPHKYTPGDDYYSNNRLVDRESISRDGEEESFYNYPTDRSEIRVKGSTHLDRGNLVTINWQNASAMSAYPFSGSNASGSVDWKHTLTIGRVAKSDPGYLALSITAISFPNMGLQLGFPNRGLLTQVEGATEGYVTETTPAVIEFTSTSPLDKGAQSSFIRLPGLTHKSFNGAQSALSKFVYHVPQFSNDGRETGNLYFAPGEKTYVALMNPTSILLNQLQVQIVDVNEKEINSLTGTTQIVFHIRKRK